MAFLISGLFVSGIFSGSLSTVSSAINSLAAVSLEDYIKPLAKSIYCRRNAMEVPHGISSSSVTEEFLKKHSSFVLKLLALFYGLTCIALTFVVSSWKHWVFLCDANGFSSKGNKSHIWLANNLCLMVKIVWSIRSYFM